MTDVKPPKVFLSYAWEDDIRTWVRDFAIRLRSDGVEAILDQWETVPGDQLPQFMEKAVRESDFVVFICTPKYKKKSDSRKGGVGYEGHIITGEVFTKNNHRKFIPILRKDKWKVSAPSWAISKYFIDLRGEPYDESKYQELLATLQGKRLSPPPVTWAEKKEIAETSKSVLPVEAHPIEKKESTAETPKSEDDEKKTIELTETEKLAHEKAENERIARQKAEDERIARDRVVARKIAQILKAEEERNARAKVEAEKKAREQAEAEKLVREKAKIERIALEKAKAEKLAAQKAEEDRIARAKQEEIEQFEIYAASQAEIAKQKYEDGIIALEKKWLDQRARLARTIDWERFKIPALIMGGGVGCSLLWWLAVTFIPTIGIPSLTPEGFIIKAPVKTLMPTQTETPPSATFTPAPPTDILFTPTASIISTPPAAGDVMVSEKDGMRLHYVPAGDFLMGENKQTTYVDAFWIDETEVTNHMYALCVGVGTCPSPHFKDSSTYPSYYDNTRYADYPVIYVSWNDAKSYCEWAGRGLPTEKQWEKAARGTDGRTYPWGNGLPNKDLVNYNSNVGDTTKVGLYPNGKSPFGALDMAGNAWEWVNDWYDSSQQYRVLRGGAWDVNERVLRVFDRIWFNPDYFYNYIGFRCARSAP